MKPRKVDIPLNCTIKPFQNRRRTRVELTESQKEDIRMAFEVFDSRKSGQLDRHELKVAIKALGFDIKKPEILDIMKEYDKNNSGFIQFNDFNEIMTQKYSERDPDEEISKAFRLFDDDNTGKISLKNLRRVARELGENITDDELQAMIDEFDKDMDGEINEDEFRHIMKQSDFM